jgi:hypothetical protein
MRTERVPLRFPPSDRARSAVLREPRGRDELSVTGVDTQAAVRLLGRLVVVEVPEGERSPGAEALSACDRDALLAALHRCCWGDRIEATLRCDACSQRYDLSFALSTLQRSLYAEARALAPALSVPSTADELCTVGLRAHEAASWLAQRSGLVSTDEADQRGASEALEAAAPLLDLELDASCCECGAPQRVGFDIQSFVLTRMLGERERLLDEVHVLADRYGWSLREILGLDRATRQSLVTRIAELAPVAARGARP